MKNLLNYFGIFLCLFYYDLKSQSCENLEIISLNSYCSFPTQDAQGGSGPDQKRVEACEDQVYKFESSLTGVGYTYLWSATGPGAPTFAPNNMSSIVNIVWPNIGNYTLTLTVNTGTNALTTTLMVMVKEKPIANFSFGPNNVCAGSSINFTNLSSYSGSMVHQWSFGDGGFSSQVNPSHIYTAPGTYNVCLISSSFITRTIQTTQGKLEEQIATCCADTLCQTVTINAGDLKIDCISTACFNTTHIYTANCNNTTWGTITGGSVVNQTGNQIEIQWGNGAVQGQIEASCAGGCTAIVTVPVIPSNPQPQGNLVPCNDGSSTYTLPLLPGTFYVYTLTDITNPMAPVIQNAALTTGPENNIVTVDWASIMPSLSGNEVFELKVDLSNEHICCYSSGSITITPRGRFFGGFDQTICLATAANLFTFPSPGTYSWSISPTTGVMPATGTGSSFMPTFATAGNYIATVTETANTYCNSPTPQTYSIKVLPAVPAPGTIQGANVVCLGNTYPYTMSIPAPSGYEYEWSIASGTGTFEPGALPGPVYGNSANINWTVVAGSISVVLKLKDNPFCSSTTTTLAVNQLMPVGTVTGPVNTCVDANLNYSITGSNLSPTEPVTWTITPASQGTIVAGQGTQNVTIKWHGGVGPGPWSGITLSATTACGALTSLTNITVYPKFTFTVSQSNTVCTAPSGATLATTMVGNSPTYAWSTGATTPTINVTNPGFYNVTITNIGGCTFNDDIEVKNEVELLVPCSIGFCNGSTMQYNLDVTVVKPAMGPFTYQYFSGVYPSGTPITMPITTGATFQTFLISTPGQYYVTVQWGICTAVATYNVPQTCCPDINTPNITNVTQNSCFDYTFTGTVGASSTGTITWNFGDGNTATGVSGQPISHTYANAGIYCVSFCVGPPTPNPTGCVGNCANTTVTVPIQALFNYKISCNGCVQPTNLSQVYTSAAFVSYQWILNGSTVSTAQNPPCLMGLINGSNTLTLVQTYNNPPINCSSTYTQTFNWAPFAMVINPPQICTNTPVSFSTNNNTFLSYSWDFGDMSSAFTPVTTHIYNAPNPSNTVSLTVLDELGNNCTITQNNVILANTSCTIMPGFICPGGSATLNAPMGVSYLWEVLSGSNWVPAIGVNSSQNYTTAVSGKYRVQVTNANGCVCISNTVDVLDVPEPVAKIKMSPSRKLCAPVTGIIQLQSLGAVSGDISNWYLGSIAPGNLITTGNNAFVPGATFTSTTNLILQVTSQYGCVAICTIAVEVNPKPAPPAMFPMTNLCEGTAYILGANSPGTIITWSTGVTGNTITATAAGTYIATATNPITGCSSQNFKTINKKPSAALFPHFCDDITCLCHNANNPFAIYAPRPLIGGIPPTYSYAWYSGMPPTGTPISPLATSNGGLDYTNAPGGVVSGSYYVQITDINTGCSTISDPYTVNVETCVDCDCRNSSFANLTYAIPGPGPMDPPTITPMDCGKTYMINCNVPITIDGDYNCAVVDCPSKIEIIITPPSGPNITGTLPFTFIPNLVGNYTFVLVGYCDGVVCNSCTATTFTVTCTPLSVDLLSFVGRQVNKSLLLNWTTAAEKNNEYFQLERSTNALVFEKISQIKSQSNNSVERLNYEFEDKAPSFGVNYYRLKAVENTGKITNTKVIAVDYFDLAKAKIYPNPSADETITLEMPLLESTNVKLEWVDMSGKVVQKQNYQGQRGANKWYITVGKLPVGKYLLNLKTQNRTSESNTVLNFERR